MSLATAIISVSQLSSARTACSVSVRPLLPLRAAPGARPLRVPCRTSIVPVAMSAAQSNLRVGFAGAGMMAEALAKGFAAANVASFSNMVATDLSEARRDVFRSAGIAIANSSKELVEKSDVLFLCTKPNGVKPLLEEVSAELTDKKLIVSIAAGVTLADIEGAAGGKARCIRVMPNTPCMVGETAACMCLGSKATQADADTVKVLFDAVGKIYQVQEYLIDAVTGLSGSGPAYVFMMIEALADGGVRAGLPRDIALGLAAQTVKGSAQMVLETGKHPGELKDQVASPGGTTIAGIHALEKAGVRAAFMDAVVAATERAKQMSKM